MRMSHGSLSRSLLQGDANPCTCLPLQWAWHTGLITGPGRRHRRSFTIWPAREYRDGCSNAATARGGAICCGRWICVVSWLGAEAALSLRRRVLAMVLLTPALAKLCDPAVGTFAGRVISRHATKVCDGCYVAYRVGTFAGRVISRHLHPPCQFQFGPKLVRSLAV